MTVSTLNAIRVPARLIVLGGACAATPPLYPPAERLWPEPPPGVQGLPDVAESEDRGTPVRPDRFVRRVTRPTLTAYLPAPAARTGAAVIICPGGGYGGLAIDKEGHDVARWLNSFGVTGFVLAYRMPRADLTPPGHKPWPVQDVQRAVRMVRGRAAALGLAPDRIGVMGFSAGGHLAATAATHVEPADPTAVDPLERHSTRPDFAILVYPVVSMRDPLAHAGCRTALLGAAPTADRITLYSAELQVTPETPPTFLVHARDDAVKPGNSQAFLEALERAGVPAELALYAKGGHGYGLGVRGGEVATWPDRCRAWLTARGVTP